jgi:phosphoribosyl-AMP cyclohydrolase / phosphoribosyl-ATP pyrophosphohydrolase
VVIAPDPGAVDFGKGLVPAVVRDDGTRQILMLAWMNRESYEKMLETGETWFWSRSRAALWNKGATSGNRQQVVRVSRDCDGDALLIDVDQTGPACHTGSVSCFETEQVPRLNLQRLENVLRQRKRDLPEDSYTASLFREGRDRILRKIGEESIEVVLAAKGEGRERIIEEASDLLVHLTALLVQEEIGLDEIGAELRRRER